jgi:hypothetical protein
VNGSATGTTWKAQQDCSHRHQTNRLSDFHLTPTRTVNAPPVSNLGGDEGLAAFSTRRDVSFALLFLGLGFSCCR